MDSRLLLSTFSGIGSPARGTISIGSSPPITSHISPTTNVRPVGSARGGGLAPPSTPSFTATAASAAQINLAWRLVRGANSYVIVEWENGAWKRIGSTNSRTSSYSVKGLSPSATYIFDVGASNAAGTSWAPYRGATTRGATTSAPAPPKFTVVAVSATQIDLAWHGVSGASGYLVDEWENGAWTQLARLASGTTSYTINGLTPNTSYEFNLYAFNSAGGNWASKQIATTLANSVVVNNPIANTPYIAVSGSLFGPDGPTYLDVQQGAVGDCWLLASLAEVAARAPADIDNMFTYDGTTLEHGSTVGVYTVRFFNSVGKPEYVTVDTELPSGGNWYDHPAYGVLWVALAEKAYAEANGAGYVTTSDVGSNSYDALNGGFPSWALQAITGKSANIASINPTNIASAWTAGQLIVLWTTTPVSPLIVASHAYAVVGYNPSSSQPYEIYNPWGTTSSGMALGDPEVYGLFYAGAAFLSQNFAWQSIGTGAAADVDDPGNVSYDVHQMQVDLDPHWHRHNH
jgi:hypothetical protein